MVSTTIVVHVEVVENDKPFRTVDPQDFLQDALLSKIGDVRRATRRLPQSPGAKSATYDVVATVAVTLSTVGVPAFVRLVRNYLDRQKARHIKLTVDGNTIEIDASSRRQQDAALRAWIEANRAVENDSTETQ
ncbi:hypothetical protein Acsp06_54100 [Actinomycetospora sp. NBRC 106375]|nr:hypothetical protein Acsp06_54100 [Actinomycetospora sp. NBRC 106375]